LKKANVGIAVHGCTDAARSAADIVLLAPGLSTIVDGVMTSRAIFQRLRSYALYRITSTIHFLLFFFIITIVEDWNMPAVLLIMICVLVSEIFLIRSLRYYNILNSFVVWSWSTKNDAATLVIAVDNTQISQIPDKWRLGQLMVLSTVLAVFLAALSFGHFYVARDVFHVAPFVLHSIMYLHISSGKTQIYFFYVMCVEFC
jgi:magnesium-transporting ATPase (P-type)